MRFNKNRNNTKIPRYAPPLVFIVTKEVYPILKTGDIFYNEHGRLIILNEPIVLPNKKHIRSFMKNGAHKENDGIDINTGHVKEPSVDTAQSFNVNPPMNPPVKTKTNNKYILKQRIRKILQVNSTRFTLLGDRLISLDNKYIFKITTEILKAFTNSKKQ